MNDSKTQSVFLAHLQSFAEELTSKFSLLGPANPEDQLKSPVDNLLVAMGGATCVEVATQSEAQVAEHKVRPDMAIYVSNLICGYIELKKPGLGANAPKLKGKHNKQQWERLKSLPNLIYTDGQEWALYRNGERVGGIIRFEGDPSSEGTKSICLEDGERFETLMRDFLSWQPLVPHQPTELARYLAPLTRFLRSEVLNALNLENSNVSYLAKEWRQFFFPDADDHQFADAYAQTVTYALLLARTGGAEKLDPNEAAATLDKGNRLLARALELLGQKGAQEELRVGFELLQRSLEALDPKKFLETKPELWLYFYEDFLAAYDRKLRNDYGVYYTPREVVEFQVRMATELLESEFDKKLGFADDGVVFLDPAVGTGTYLVSAVDNALNRVRDHSGGGAVPGRATHIAENMYAFEILVGPYAVAHLRLTQAIEGAGGSLPGNGRLKIYLADTLESPNATPSGGLTLTYKTLTEEHEAARKLKQGGAILVCIGNPPYDRQQIAEGEQAIQRKGGWVRFGDQITGGAKQEHQGELPILEDFLEPARKAGQGIHLKNLYNDYIYFWRWALWRMFEKQTGGGIVTFITASSYLAGPGFVGMREVMRRTFDELWIIDLGGDNLGTRRTPNVFNIQTPVAIAIGVRSVKSSPEAPAKVWHAKITGATRDEKLKQIEDLKSISDLEWHTCAVDWHKPFLPIGLGDYFDWPLLTDLFPWSHSGAQFKRTWPIGETCKLLQARFDRFTSAPANEQKALFKETRDRDIGFTPTQTDQPFPPIRNMGAIDISDLVRPYAFRSFDRHFAILDTRFGDYLRPPLIGTAGSQQIFFTTMLTVALAEGPAIVAATNVPDLHHFRGSFGGKDVMPLYRNAEATDPNITDGLLDLLRTTYATHVEPEDLAAYVYVLLGGQSYTQRFWNELETPGPRIPITKDADVFQKAVALGKRLIWLHTFGERFIPEGQAKGIPPGAAKQIEGVPHETANYPEEFGYDSDSREILIGSGRFGPVAEGIWEFEVSGLKVVQSWLGYRMKKRFGKKSSLLDEVRPENWTARMSDELLELLWILEGAIELEPELASVLTTVVQGQCLKADELPQPSDEERKAPAMKGHSEQTDLFG